ILLLAAIANIPAYAQQEQDYSSESLFMAVFANGDALVEYDVSIGEPLAMETKIKLFGGAHINDLIVADYDGKLVEYDVSGSPNEIVLNTTGVSNVRISYSTPDLVDKSEGLWTFSLNATTGFSVRLPPNTVLVGTEPIPTIKIVNDDQPLLTFDKPGSIRVTYAIGVLGTADQANIAIQLASATIRETGNKYPGINVTGAQDLLQRANTARDNGRFAEAESLADKANNAAVATGKDYDGAKTAIAEANSQIKQASDEGRDVTYAKQLLGQANTEFGSGNYAAAKSSAEAAVGALAAKPPDQQMPATVIIAGAIAAAGGVGALVFLKRRKQPAMWVKRDPPKISNNRTTTVIRPPAEMQEEEMGEQPADAEELVEEEQEAGVPVEQGTIPDSQINRSVLGRIVGSILEERPHLRPEDRQVLKFLAEKEGAAFESEIRTKFQLPKTTIWRLVKRLEREELVEIRKAGGQNLIKLKFEDRMP
ncbi:MAG TPA: hypothetical protein VGJ42_01085, partial [Nitrososphaera sp.]